MEERVLEAIAKARTIYVFCVYECPVCTSACMTEETSDLIIDGSTCSELNSGPLS